MALAALLTAASSAQAQVELPEINNGAPVAVAAESGNHWIEGSYEVWVLRGNCRVRQGDVEARGQEAVLWITQVDTDKLIPRKVIAYLEGNVVVEMPRDGSRVRLADTQWLGRFTTRRGVEVHAGVVGGEPKPMPSIHSRATAERDPQSSAIRPTQYAAPLMAGPAAPAPPPGARRVRALPRGDTIPDAQWFPDPASNQWIAVIDSGVTLIVDGLREYGSIDVSTDRLIIWTSGLSEPDLSGQRPQAEDVPLEIYMEGNIVFRQGTRIIYADRMYYDVRRQTGTIVNAEVLTPVPKYEGLVRLRTQLLQQTGPSMFVAQDSYFTSSRMGAPSYRVQAGDVTFQDIQQPVLDPLTGQPAVDPSTGEPLVEHNREVSGRNAFVFLGDIPVFYWPVFSTNLENASYYVRRFRVRNDSIFGTQILTDWDAYQLFGIRHPPEGTDWGVTADYLDKRGFGHGTTFVYQRPDFFGWPTPSAGLIDYWGIQDKGVDILPGRAPLPPEADYRYRLLIQHRQHLSDNFELRAEVGPISDRNFLEEYFRREWDQFKDLTTGVELKQRFDNISWSVTGDVRVNDFFTQTEWLPRLDHFWLGQPLVNDAFTWYEHTSIGYGRLGVADPPPNRAADPFILLPWEFEREGERLVTRQELDWPLQLGPVKVVPYALGELGHWGQDIEGNDLDRAYGQLGLRASMPMWRAYPDVESELWNVHGVAHKIVFDAELLWADSNHHVDELPLYDPLNDDNVEAFQRRFDYRRYQSLGIPPGLIPGRFGMAPMTEAQRQFYLRFDERYYALRSGMASWVTAPSMEIADQLTEVRLGVRQRWQTKRGMAGQRRIIDWIVFDTNLTFFPDPSRDNFGSNVGLWDYDFRWFVGDRLTLVSEGIFDFFDQGQRQVSFGAFLSRPPRGNLFVGLNLMDGPFSPSRMLSASYSYWMSPKWISSYGVSIDLAGNRSVGQNLSVTRVGESFLISAGFTFDVFTDNVGANFAIEPRFAPGGRLGTVGGARVPVAGAYGLE